MRSKGGTVIMSSSLKHRHGPPVITVVPEICVRNTPVPRPAHRSVTHSLVLKVLISHPLHLHMNEKSSQLVNYRAVRATIEAIPKFILLTLTFIPQ